MRISFDIDDTLVCLRPNGRRESGLAPAFIGRHFAEPLRLGTRSLFRELRRLGCHVWIYTSSLRSPLYIRLWLLLHGVRIDGVINDDSHRRALAGRSFSRMPSKYPPAFGIQLHIDDSDGVKMEGDKHGFRVLVIHPEDDEWTRKVLDAVKQKMEA